MNEAQSKQIQDLVQEIADDEGISFNDAFSVAMGILKLHAHRTFSGEGREGSSTQSSCLRRRSTRNTSS